MEDARALLLTADCSSELVPKGYLDHLLHSPTLRTKTKLANLVTNRPGWPCVSPAQVDALHMAEEERQNVPDGRTSHVGHLGTLAHDLSFQKTSLDFSHASQGFGREETENASPPKGQPQTWHITSICAIVQSVQASPESSEWRSRLLAQWRRGVSVQRGTGWMAVKLTPSLRDLSCLPVASATQLQAHTLVYVFLLSDAALGMK